MSRYRAIHCLVWQDDKFPSAGDDLQLLWFHLKTTPFSTPLGIFYAPIAGLASEKHWTEERYRRRLVEGSVKGFWKVDETSHVVYFPNYFRYNKPDNPKVLQSWLKCWDEVPVCGLKDECYQQLTSYCREWGENYTKVLDTSPYTYRVRIGNVPDTVTVTVTGTVTAPKGVRAPAGANNGEENHFSDVRKEYPAHRRDTESVAFDSWARLNPDLDTQKLIMRGILALKESESWTRDKGRYVPGFAKFLDSRGWEAAELVREIPPDPPGGEPKPPRGMKWKRDENGELVHPMEAVPK